MAVGRNDNRNHERWSYRCRHRKHSSPAAEPEYGGWSVPQSRRSNGCRSLIREHTAFAERREHRNPLRIKQISKNNRTTRTTNIIDNFTRESARIKCDVWSRRQEISPALANIICPGARSTSAKPAFHQILEFVTIFSTGIPSQAESSNDNQENIEDAHRKAGDRESGR